jgi:hypothetical protein
LSEAKSGGYSGRIDPGGTRWNPVMDKPVQENANRSRRGSLSVAAFGAIAETVGRHGVRLYGLPRQQQLLVWFALILIGLPSFTLLAMMPIWERVGDVWWIAKLNQYVAPAIGTVTSEYRLPGAPHFPLRRFLVAATTFIELLLLVNFASMFLRKVRKHALLVWLCFDRQKLFLFLAISGSVFAGLWYAFFFNWQILDFLSSTRPGQRVITYSLLTMPSVALVFSHLVAIVVLGLGRTTSKTMKRSLRRRKVGKVAPHVG